MSSIIKDNILSVINPISQECVETLDCSSLTEVQNTIDKAKNYKEWSKLSLKKRCQNINKFRKAILKNQDKLKKIINSETGKKDFDILIELFTLLEHIKEISKIAKKSLKPSYRNTGIMKTKKAYVVYEPKGIAGIIAPWNYPLATPITSTVEALLSGNNVILKPSEHTPLTSIYIKEIWDKYIGYQDAFNIIVGDGQIGEILVESKLVDIICFTGSSRVGKIIASKCANQLKPFILELGGKDPMIVLKDANLSRAIQSALFAGFSNAGQTCISVEEIFVEDELFDDFIKSISSKVKDLSSGDSESMQIGSMIMDVNCSKVREHIEEIKATSDMFKGSTVKHPMYIAPTIVVNPDDNSRIVNEETFGPVISIRRFESEDELLKKVHKTGYGLAGSIFGSNKKRIKRILSQLKIGNVSINDVMTHYGIASLPFGGEGYSGLGRLHGKEGLRALCRVKSVVENRFWFIPDPWWFNRPRFTDRLLKSFIKYYYNI